VQKIRVCPNDCILYHGEEYKNLDACPICTALRYKIDEMILVMLRTSLSGRGFLPR
jgi:hypothetical protein